MTDSAPLPRHLWPTTEWTIRDPSTSTPDYGRVLEAINADGLTTKQLPKP